MYKSLYIETGYKERWSTGKQHENAVTTVVKNRTKNAGGIEPIKYRTTTKNN